MIRPFVPFFNTDDCLCLKGLSDTAIADNIHSCINSSYLATTCAHLPSYFGYRIRCCLFCTKIMCCVATSLCCATTRPLVASPPWLCFQNETPPPQPPLKKSLTRIKSLFKLYKNLSDTYYITIAVLLELSGIYDSIVSVLSDRL